jgi:hypothetical protein
MIPNYISRNKIKVFLKTFIIATFISSCLFTWQIPTTSATQILPTSTQKDSADSAKLTDTPRMTISVAQTLASSPEYLLGCKNISANVSVGQVAYRKILPGTTSLSDAKTLLGEPLYKTDIQWVYDKFSVTTDDQNNIKEIDIVGGSDYELYSIPTREIIHAYGCPEIIFAFDDYDHPSGDFSITSFEYPSIGVEFNFPKYPISLDDKPDLVVFFKPKSLQELLFTDDWLLTSPDKVIVVSWDEAVIY